VVKDADSGSPDQNGGIGSGADCGAPPGAAFTYKVPGTGEQRRACALPRPDPTEVSSGEFPKYGDLSGGGIREVVSGSCRPKMPSLPPKLSRKNTLEGRQVWGLKTSLLGRVY